MWDEGKRDEMIRDRIQIVKEIDKLIDIQTRQERQTGQNRQADIPSRGTDRQKDRQNNRQMYIQTGRN